MSDLKEIFTHFLNLIRLVVTILNWLKLIIENI